MQKQLIPATQVATAEGKHFLTIDGMPGIKVSIVDPFRDENNDDHFFEIEPNGSIGRIKPPANYKLFGKNGHDALNRLKKRAGENANEAFEKANKSVDQFDGVGEKTLIALESAGLITPQLIHKAGADGLKIAGVNRSLIKQILTQASDVVDKQKVAQSHEGIVRFFDNVAKASHYGLELRVYAEGDDSKSILFYTVDGKKNITKAKLKDTNDFGGKVSPHYLKKVQVKPADNTKWQGAYHTEQIEDTIRYAYVSDDNMLHSGDITIASQGGEFFLSVQEIYCVPIFKKGNKVVFPELESRRPQFCEFFRNNLVMPITEKLLPVSAYKPKANFDLRTLKDNELLIDYFSVAQRQGRGVKLSKNSGKLLYVVIHYSEIETDGIARLDKGDIVSFGGLKPIEVTSHRKVWEGHKFQASNVRFVTTETERARTATSKSVAKDDATRKNGKHQQNGNGNTNGKKHGGKNHHGKKFHGKNHKTVNGNGVSKTADGKKESGQKTVSKQVAHNPTA